MTRPSRSFPFTTSSRSLPRRATLGAPNPARALVADTCQRTAPDVRPSAHLPRLVGRPNLLGSVHCVAGRSLRDWGRAAARPGALRRRHDSTGNEGAAARWARGAARPKRDAGGGQSRGFRLQRRAESGAGRGANPRAAQRAPSRGPRTASLRPATTRGPRATRPARAGEATGTCSGRPARGGGGRPSTTLLGPGSSRRGNTFSPTSYCTFAKSVRARKKAKHLRSNTTSRVLWALTKLVTHLFPHRGVLHGSL